MFLRLPLASQKRLLVYFQAGIAALFVAAIFGIGARPAHAITCGFGSDTGNGTCRGFITSTTATTWTVPSDWNSASNTIEAIGPGGADEGGGGGYGKITN